MELIDGTKLSVPRTNFIPFEIKYGEFEKLGKMEGIQYFDCWGELYRQYIINIYDNKRDFKLSEGDTIVDAGTHIGVFTIKASRAVGNEGKVIAIEPDPNNLEFLRENIKINQLKNVIVMPKAICSKKGKSKLYLSERFAEHSLFSLGISSDKSIEVETDTLDNMLRELGIKRVNFVKMNIEGAELEALQGMEETLKDNDTIRVVIAAHHIVDGEYTYITVARQLTDKGFDVQLAKDMTVYAFKKLPRRSP